MSERRKLIAGAVIVLILAWLLASSGIDVVTRQSKYLTPVFPPGTVAAQVVSAWMAVSTVVLVLLGAWTIVKGHDRFKAWNDRFSIHATIPGYFFFALLPAGMGIVLMTLTGQAAWGCWLSCLSLPVTALFLWIALRVKSN